MTENATATLPATAPNPKTEGRPFCVSCEGGWGPRDETLLGKPWICSWCRTRAEMDSQMEELRKLPKVAPKPTLPPNDEEAIAGLRVAKAPPKEPKEPKGMSCLDAAAQVLASHGAPMTCFEMIDAMATQGLWVSPGGKTPAATLYSAIYRECQKKGNGSRFVAQGKGAAAGFTYNPAAK